LPPGKIVLETRPPAKTEREDPASLAAGKAPASAARLFVIRVLRNKITRHEIQRTCVIVYPGGSYRLELKSQAIGSSDVQMAVFEDLIPSAEISRLRQILGDPHLVERHYQELPQHIPLIEGDIVSLYAPRGDSIQRLSFWKYFAAIRIGAAGIPDVQDNGIKLFQPVSNWLKANVDSHKVPPLKGARPSNCVARPPKPFPSAPLPGPSI
jgi:hypothetical protein